MGTKLSTLMSTRMKGNIELKNWSRPLTDSQREGKWMVYWHPYASKKMTGKVCRNEKVPSWKHKNTGLYPLLALWWERREEPLHVEKTPGRSSVLAIKSDFRWSQEMEKWKMEGQRSCFTTEKSFHWRSWGALWSSVGGTKENWDGSTSSMRKKRWIQRFG